jgi:hypothetical protein
MSILQFIPSAENLGHMEERSTRVENLKALVSAAGGIAAFARTHPGVDPTYVSQLINGHRNFGERAARNMETKIGLARGSLDQAPGASADPAGWPFPRIPKVRFDQLTDSQRKGIEDSVLRMIDAFLGEAPGKSEQDERAA